MGVSGESPEKRKRIELDKRNDKYIRVTLNKKFNILGTFRKLDHLANNRKDIIFKPSRDFIDTWLFKRDIECKGLGDDKTLYIVSNKGKFYITDDEIMLPYNVDTAKILDELLHCDDSLFLPYSNNSHDLPTKRLDIYRQVGELQDRMIPLKQYLITKRWDELRRVNKKKVYIKKSE